MTVAALACLCGARDEVREPCPNRLTCWQCGMDTMERWEPLHVPPLNTARELTAAERGRMSVEVRAAFPETLFE